MAGPKLKTAKNPYGLWVLAFFILLGGWMAYPLLERAGQDLDSPAPGGAVGVKTSDVNDVLELGANPESSAPGGPVDGAGGAERRDNVAMIARSDSGLPEPGSAPKPSAASPSAPAAADDLDAGMRKGDSYERKGGGLSAFKGLDGAGGGGFGGGASAGGGEGGAAGRSGGAEISAPFGLGGRGELSDSRGGFGDVAVKPQGGVEGRLKGLSNQAAGLSIGQDEASKNRGNAFFDAEKKKGGAPGAKGGSGGALAQLKQGADTVASLKPNADAVMQAKTTVAPPAPRPEQKEKPDNTLQMMGMMVGMLNPMFSGIVGAFK